MKRLLITVFVILFVGVALGKLLVFDLARVAGSDMAPALQPGDLLLANRLAGPPGRGDLIFFEHPAEPGHMLIRRVLGLPGERVEVRAEVPHINGTALERTVLESVELVDQGHPRVMRVIEERAPNASAYRVLKDPGRRSRDPRPVTLGPRQFYVLADDRNHAHDSRDFGPVPETHIRGRLTHRLTAGPGNIKGQPARAGCQRLAP